MTNNEYLEYLIERIKSEVEEDNPNLYPESQESKKYIEEGVKEKLDFLVELLFNEHEINECIKHTYDRRNHDDD